VRRKFFDVHAATGSPIAKEALDRIGQLYAVEKIINGLPPGDWPQKLSVCRLRCRRPSRRRTLLADRKRQQRM
jgi:hypothetical protein